MLTPDERALLFRTCWNHPVAKCTRCDEELRAAELAGDLFPGHACLCPSCRLDLTDSIREHLNSCEAAAVLDAQHLVAEAKALRAASADLRKEAHQLRDAAGVARAESEALCQKHANSGTPLAPSPVTPDDAQRPAPLVLIVDDHEDTRDLYSLYLATHGMRVLAVGDGATAIRMALDARPDVVVTDLSLPQVDGYEVIRRLKQTSSTAHMLIVACSGRAEGSRAAVAGCDAYIRKPCLPEDLVKEICALLAAPGGQRHT